MSFLEQLEEIEGIPKNPYFCREIYPPKQRYVGNPRKDHLMKLLYTIPLLALLIVSCRPDDNFITDPAAMLEFSKDTLTFDTVFTELGSATRILKVFNPHPQPVKINRISLLFFLEVII